MGGVPKKHQDLINEFLAHFPDDESNWNESLRTAELEISATIEKHQSDNLKKKFASLIRKSSYLADLPPNWDLRYQRYKILSKR